MDGTGAARLSMPRASSRRRQEEERTAHLMSTAVLVAAAAVAQDEAARSITRPGRVRRRYELRERPTVEMVFQHFSDAEFAGALRLDRNAFARLLDVLRPALERNVTQGSRSSTGVIEPGVRLAIALRMLAGGSHWDLMANFRVGRTTIYQVFHETIDAVFEELRLPGIPNDLGQLRALADDFNRSRPILNPLNGCISAIDGIAIALRSPRAEYLPSLYYCRKGFFALPVQACCNAKYRFQYFSAREVGSTHDSLAFSLSSLYAFLEEGGLPPCYWIAGDTAYTCTEYLLTPYSKAALLLHGFETSRDAYNLFQSSHRVHIEQAFGLLVRRFGIFWRPLAFDLPRCSVIVGVMMRLHNWCIDHNARMPQEMREAQNDYEEAFSRWWENATSRTFIKIVPCAMLYRST
jgi:hypothetical protein